MCNFIVLYQNGRRIKKYRGMGSLEAMTKGSDQRYLGDTAKLKIAQGVVGAVADKGSVLKFVPYTMQAVKQGFQDLGAASLQSAHDLLRSGVLRLEVWLPILHLFLCYSWHYYQGSQFYHMLKLEMVYQSMMLAIIYCSLSFVLSICSSLSSKRYQ